MDKAVFELKNKGIRVTPQRLEVFTLLRGKNKHLTVGEICGKIKKRFPALSVATVYAILDLFKQKRLVSEVRIQPDCACFETNIELHHHFFCRKCKKIIDLDMPSCQALRWRRVQGHEIEELAGYIYGICRECGRKQ